MSINMANSNYNIWINNSYIILLKFIANLIQPIPGYLHFSSLSNYNKGTHK